MNIKKLPNGNLEITIHQLEQNALKPVGKRLQTSSYERKFIGTFLQPKGYRQIKPEECGALTDAPLITDGQEVWGYMDYQVKSFLEELAAGLAKWWTNHPKRLIL